MYAIDERLMMRQVEARLEETKDDRHRAMLKIVLDHLEAEEEKDLDKLMGTLGPDPVYRIWRLGEDIGPKGTDGVLEYYTSFALANRFWLEYDIETIVVDDRAVVTDGPMKTIVPGSLVLELTELEADPDEPWLREFRQSVIWPFDAEGRLIGEEFTKSGYYVGGKWRKLDRDEVPPAWFEGHENVKAAAS